MQPRKFTLKWLLMTELSHYHSPEIRQKPLRRFIQNYANETGRTLILPNHTGMIECLSNPADIKQRTIALNNYFDQPPTDNSWGRTIFSEIVTRQLMRQTLNEQIQAANLRLVLVPTSIDKSSNEKYPQKGADLLFLERSKNLPLLAIDVTCGSWKFYAKKIARPGIQPRLALPVITLHLRQIISPEEELSFPQFLDEVMRQRMPDTSSYMKSLDLPTRLEWQRIFIANIQMGLEICACGLENAKNDQLDNYPYYSDVIMNKLLLTRAIFSN